MPWQAITYKLKHSQIPAEVEHYSPQENNQRIKRKILCWDLWLLLHRQVNVSWYLDGKIEVIDKTPIYYSGTKLTHRIL